ncbi:histidine kinase [Hymenobacter sp. 15J16-1T3B]|uniref:sensor histidine kinase n=1 Tax=Hymenobacter sp. 15J16-1T3B TaxID=2886941 RepID=UPI001D1230A9|nr:ATP-binding protein [Hymenobacter sp. 15J16-1T3B]MCC3156183.1 histidine kinase [Hymenobacter sp. 15J16-1T3B]
MPTTATLTADDLTVVPALQGLPDEVLTWLLTHGEPLDAPVGTELFRPGDPVDYLLILLRGAVQMWREQNGHREPFLRVEAPQITGLLPYSRLRQTTALGMIVADAQLLRLHRDQFPELERISPELVQRLVGLMSDRVREEARTQERDDKLRALGKLSAGLAHELNNPAAAISRSAAELSSRTGAGPMLLQEVLAAGTPAEQLPALLQLASHSMLPGASLSALEQADCEEELEDWLLQQGISDVHGLATGLLSGGLDADVLGPVLSALPAAARPPALRWLEGQLTSHQLVRDVQEASRRISELVHNVKDYSHMDRAGGFVPTDLHGGLDSTLALLSYPLRQHRIRVVRDYAQGLLSIQGQPGALNQVWTNLLDNAIDALPATGGTITLRTRRSGEYAQVCVEDDGPGIPADVLPHIFEPFFTTKPMGEGTGMGLDIARRIVLSHGGRVNVSSQPGRTEFCVWLPMED